MGMFNVPYFYIIFIKLIFALRNSNAHFSPKGDNYIDRHVWTNFGL